MDTLDAARAAPVIARDSTMTPKANGLTYAQFRAAGWTLPQLIEHGYLVAPVRPTPGEGTGYHDHDRHDRCREDCRACTGQESRYAALARIAGLKPHSRAIPWNALDQDAPLDHLRGWLTYGRVPIITSEPYDWVAAARGQFREERTATNHYLPDEKRRIWVWRTVAYASPYFPSRTVLVLLAHADDAGQLDTIAARLEGTEPPFESMTP
jgi:hypothetical protein